MTVKKRSLRKTDQIQCFDRFVAAEITCTLMYQYFTEVLPAPPDARIQLLHGRCAKAMGASLRGHQSIMQKYGKVFTWSQTQMPIQSQ
jgi:hypothetical protein